MSDSILQGILVLAILAVACYMAIINNASDIIYNLCGVAFGYYFANRERVYIPKR